MAVDARVIEKDFWVCWTLDQLFSLPGYADHFLFKGGTTLSKIFRVITRFSEDVDIAVNWKPLGFAGDRDPTAPMTGTQRAKLLAVMLEECRSFVAGELKDVLEGRFSDRLEQEWSLDVDPATPDALTFHYPRALSLGRSYIKDPVVLELGTHAEWVPHADQVVVPYAAEMFPTAFVRSSVSVRALDAERTFWEKATILHAEHHRPAAKPTPLRYSRHYYDTVMLARSEHGRRALSDLALLKQVVDHKQMFYRSAWARYDLAVPGSLRLVPAVGRVGDLRADYAAMEIMFFESRPDFEELLGELRELERSINGP